MDITDIRQQADEFLREVLVAFRSRHPDLLLTALDCECDPETAALHISVCDAFHDRNAPVAHWPYRNLEDESGDLATPVWVGQYQQIIHLHFSAAIDGSEVQAALLAVLQGIAASVRELRKKNALGELGFAANPVCRVWTEDEDVMAQLQASLR